MPKERVRKVKVTEPTRSELEARLAEIAKLTKMNRELAAKLVAVVKRGVGRK